MVVAVDSSDKEELISCWKNALSVKIKPVVLNWTPIFASRLSSIVKLFIGLLFFNKKKTLIHYYRLSGLFNAFFKKPSWLRPNNI